jgi:hypothetical protein
MFSLSKKTIPSCLGGHLQFSESPKRMQNVFWARTSIFPCPWTSELSVLILSDSTTHTWLLRFSDPQTQTELYPCFSYASQLQAANCGTCCPLTFIAVSINVLLILFLWITLILFH